MPKDFKTNDASDSQFLFVLEQTSELIIFDPFQLRGQKNFLITATRNYRMLIFEITREHMVFYVSCLFFLDFLLFWEKSLGWLTLHFPIVYFSNSPAVWFNVSNK